MKIGHYLAKIWTRVWYLPFLNHGVGLYITGRHFSDPQFHDLE